VREKIMNSKTKIFSVIEVAVVATFLMVNSVTSALASSAGYKVGYRDGRDHPFSQEKFSKYGDSYLRGFMAGCMSVPGNTRAACNGATDAG
jgi:hypothetical protein